MTAPIKDYQPSEQSLAMLHALAATGKHVYAGTVPAATKRSRRAKNKIARRSRRLNRRA
jgi:hypothetical protein